MFSSMPNIGRVGNGPLWKNDPAQIWLETTFSVVRNLPDCKKSFWGNFDQIRVSPQGVCGGMSEVVYGAQIVALTKK